MFKDEALKLAESLGAHHGTARNSMSGELLYYIEPAQLLALANACEKIGMEKAAKISDVEIAKHDEFCTCSTAIRKSI